jgi:DNA-directed RNA polymerase sigma subunit (sigma70/sigma32)
MENRRVREVHVRSQEEVARLLRISQPSVARAEQSAMRKLRANPEARWLMRYVSQQSFGADYIAPTISGFAPNL